MTTRITIEQLEQMKTHELADLLGNVAMLLKRMPDVACSELIQPIPSDEAFMQPELSQRSSPAESWTQAGLKKKKVAELKEIADDRHILYGSKATKDELIAKILAGGAPQNSVPTGAGLKKDDQVNETLARSPHGGSEQYTITELKEKTVIELKKIADGLFIAYSGSIRKDDLINKILTRAASGYSEQYAIRDL